MPAALPDNGLRLLELAAQLLRTCHPELAARITAGLQEHVATNADLARTLSRTGSLSRTPRFEVLQDQRNELLRQAWAVLNGDSAALAREIKNYSERVPKVARERLEPDPHWPEARVLIHQADHLNVGMPTSVFRLHEAMRKTSESRELPPAEVQEIEPSWLQPAHH